MRVYLSLGSNLGDRVSNIRQAIEFLRNAGCEIRRVSSFYRTEPVDVHDQPWFVNCVAEADTGLSPRALLHTALAYESLIGRRRTLPKGPRPIDIDVLLYGDLIVKLPALQIPHPRMAERRFVLIPFKEIAPEVEHPVTHKTVSKMLRETADASKVVKLKKEMTNDE